MSNNDVVVVAGKEVVCFKQGDVEYVSITHVCKSLGISAQDQITKLKANEDFTTKDILGTGTDGKSYTMVCLPAKQVTLWLYTINTNKVSPETKSFLKSFKMELEDAVHEFYNSGVVFNQKKYNEDPDVVIEQMARQIIEMIENKKQMRAALKAAIDQGSLNEYDGMLSTDQFKQLRHVDMTVGEARRLGQLCVKYCDDNNIEYGTNAMGSAFRGTNAYPLIVLDKVWKEMQAGTAPVSNPWDPFLNSDLFDLGDDE